MSYTYRNKGTGQQAEQQKQKLVFGILSHRRAIAGISARITTLDGQRDQEIAQAIWDDVDVPTVASAAGLTSAAARSIGLTRNDLPHSGTTAATHIESIQALTQQAERLRAKHAELQQQQKQLIVKALESGALDPPWVAAISGRSIDHINALARARAVQNHLKTDTGPDTPKPASTKPRKNLGDEKKQ